MTRKALYSCLILFFFLTATGQARAQNILFKSEQEYQSIKVTRVLSVNKIVLENDETITLIGLKAPALPEENQRQELRDQFGFIVETQPKPYDSLETRALEYVKNLLEGKTVRLEFDKSKNARDYSTLAYIFLPDGRMANAEILRQGYAGLTIEPRNKKYTDELRAAYQEARTEKRGLAGQ